MVAPSASRIESSTRLIGKYRLLKRIARGGMGDIWIAQNEATRAHVAVKLLRAEHAEREDAAKRFRHEAQLASVLGHRNIIKIFDLLEERDGTLALVMELLRGESLLAYTQRKPVLSAAETLAIMIPIISALGHAHDNEVVHRDIKPANILLAREPDGVIEPKLLDFGIAKTHGTEAFTQFGQVLGTPKYMSPEQIRAASLDGRSDLFSATTVIYELLTGRNPFEADAPSASLVAVLETVVDQDPKIDPRLWLVLKRAFAKQPYERFATAAEYIEALRGAMPELTDEIANALRGEPLKGTQPIEGDSTWSEFPDLGDSEAIDLFPKKAGSTWRRWAIGAAVASAVAGGVAFRFHSAPTPPPLTSTSSAETEKAATPPAIAPATLPAVSTPPTEKLEEPPAPSVHTSATTRAAPHAPSAKKKIATTPGF